MKQVLPHGENRELQIVSICYQLSQLFHATLFRFQQCLVYLYDNSTQKNETTKLSRNQVTMRFIFRFLFFFLKRSSVQPNIAISNFRDPGASGLHQEPNSFLSSYLLPLLQRRWTTPATNLYPSTGAPTSRTRVVFKATNCADEGRHTRWT